MAVRLLAPVEPVFDILDALLELGDDLQDLANGLFGSDVSSCPLAEERFEGIGAHKESPFTRVRVRRCKEKRLILKLDGPQYTRFRVNCQVPLLSTACPVQAGDDGSLVAAL